MGNVGDKYDWSQEENLVGEDGDDVRKIGTGVWVNFTRVEVGNSSSLRDNPDCKC